MREGGMQLMPRLNVPSRLSWTWIDQLCPLSHLQSVGHTLNFFSQIPDPSTTKKEEGANDELPYLFCSYLFHKIKNYCIFEEVQRKNLSQLTKKYFLSKKLLVCTKLWEIWVGDLGSGKNLSRIRNLGSKENQILNPDPQHCLQCTIQLKSPSGGVSNICLSGPLLFRSFEFCLV